MSDYSPAPVYTELGEGFFDEVEPALFPKPALRFRNQKWAGRVGLDTLDEAAWLRHFGAYEPLPRNFPKPLALRYHGHQFQSYNPDLGDGRGFLFAQLRDRDGRLLDLGTKGSGQTPYSRAGDGRLTLKGAVREALATEMLEALGVYTSKTFSFVETGESLQRHDEPSPTRAATLTRLSHSHVRYGTFQRQAFERNADGVRKLIDYSCRYLLPGTEPTAPAFLREVVKRAADLTASWMVAGFVHGVLNTDNMNITGESFDYGPYRFLPTYDPEFTAAYFDSSGLYAYGRQPETVLWNLEQLGTCLTYLSDAPPLRAALEDFPHLFNAAAVVRLIARFGLKSAGEEKDAALFVAAFNVLAMTQVPFEQFFFDWHGGLSSSARAKKSPSAALYAGEHYDEFLRTLGNFEPAQNTVARLKEPYYRGEKPCSLLIDEIEWIWDAIAIDDDWSRFETKIAAIRERGKVHGYI